MELQSFAELKNVLDNNDELDNLREQLAEIQAKHRQHYKRLSKARKEHNDAKQRARYEPDDDSLQEEVSTARELMESELAVSKDYSEQEQYLRSKIERILFDQHEQQEKLEASEMNLEVDVEDPVLRAACYASIAQAAQFNYVSGKNFMRTLIDRVYDKNSEQPGTPVGDTINQSSSEIAQSHVDKLEEMRNKRREIRILRHAARMRYEDAIAEIPESVNYRPKLYRQTDEELEQQIAEKKGRRAQQKAANTEACRTIEQDYFRMEDVFRV